jgi:asparagine synthase (glutamine-hydrolysing)
MSGICAVYRKDDPALLSVSVRSINAALSRSPGESRAQESEHAAGVGVSSRFPGQQIHRGRRALVVCDADLLNEQELWEAAGTKRDAGPQQTAALLQALYERFGKAFIEKLRGAFSLALWDLKERLLIAAIDGFGMKRLVYGESRTALLIASRVDALAQCGAGDGEINPKAILNVLNFTSNQAPETIFSNIHRLVPGSMLVASQNGTKVEKYWDMRYGVGGRASAAELSRELESVMERSVADHCQGNSFTELGAFLSGGTDSSTVVGMMARAAEGTTKAFSIGFEEQRFNELEYAQITARRFGSEHHTYLVGPKDCFDALPEMVRYFDEPFGNSSAIPTYFCARLAAQNGVKILLAGDGGDELFGGNERYATDKMFAAYHSIPRFLRRGLIEPVLGALPLRDGLVRKARGYIRRANMPGVERMLSYHFLRSHSLEEIFEGEFLRQLGTFTVLDISSDHYANAPARDHLDRLLYVDMKITLADNDLPKVTCMSELAGIQVRFPYLDRSVAEFSGRIPARLKVKGFEKRYLFKRAFRELLPAEILQKKKHGFGIPVATWLNSDARMRELSRDVLLSARSFGRGYFRRQFIEDLFRRAEGDDSTYYGDTLWTFLALELWHRQVVDQSARRTT